MRKLKLKINDKDYTLEMNRDSIKWQIGRAHV